MQSIEVEYWNYAAARKLEVGGPDRDRTGDLMNAIHARSQLRHWPTLESIYRSTSDGTGLKTGSYERFR